MGSTLTLLTAIALLAGGLVALWREVRRTRAETALATQAATDAAAEAAAAAKAAGEVHLIVNQQRTDMQRYTAVLIAALTAAGIEVPADASLAPTKRRTARKKTPPPV